MKTSVSQKKLPVFAERFRELRGDMTQDKFADFVGISRPTVGFYENGDRLPDALVLKKIAEKCRVSSDWLIGLSDVKNTDMNIHSVSEITGLSSSSIEFLCITKRHKDACLKIGTQKKHYVIDVLNYILENLDYFGNIIFAFCDLCDSKAKGKPEICDDEISDKIFELDEDLHQKIYSNGTILLGYNYQSYLLETLKKDLDDFIHFMLYQINPTEGEKEFFEIIKTYRAHTKLTQQLTKHTAFLENSPEEVVLNGDSTKEG